MWLRALIIILLVFSLGCSHAIKSILPLETETKTGEIIEKIEPAKVGDRSDIPVGVKPSEVVAEVKTKTGAKVWIVKKHKTILKDKVEVYQNKQAVAEGITVEKPKKSWAWLYWIIGIITLLLGANYAMKAFLGFNPIALAGGWVARMFRNKK